MSEEMLAQLIGQAESEGAELVTLRAIAEEAGTLGAQRALARLGLEDAGAAKDMSELRELLGAWRDAKRSAFKAAFQWAGRMVAALVLVGLAVKLGFPGWLR
ncbi:MULTISPECIES: DUF6127 family protein [Sphingomonas]|uniref:DUF6127 family protein n=1 Tax=Sphingomonas TaxID=13687 RepID=UPI0009639C1E|nr:MULTISPECIES: DUF6127 family protein [unclassified Sphingomonas]MBN8809788.1 hypothetical protein [Sphingomonas sp.]MDF2383217.1 hypothetical protein [Nostoc ellipsosporum NOK]OJY50413.1 MAG: hypothetical protein BGP17_18330 [Sphingomonas sp. 67-41]OSZ69473.1 hypothetical protein CAP40_01030 [Sphingomonas sp. IBVSS2]